MARGFVRCGCGRVEDVAIIKCDLCSRVAIWRHPAGGFRCDKCPRPSRKEWIAAKDRRKR